MVKSLPHTYLPGPLCYLSRSDAFLTVSSNFHLECYKYVKRMKLNWEENVQILDIKH
jgi:hypothetical protein